MINILRNITIRLNDVQLNSLFGVNKNDVKQLLKIYIHKRYNN